LLTLLCKVCEICSADSHEDHKICCHQMSYFKTKKHQIRFRLGLCPRPRWGSLQHSPDPLAGGEGAGCRSHSRPCGPRFSRLWRSAFRFFFVYNSNPACRANLAVLVYNTSNLPVIVISADTTDSFKRRLGKIWQHQDTL